MVCMDGFVLTHAVEGVDVPGPEQIDAFLPPFVPRQVLDPDDPMTIGAMVGPEAFTEVRYLMHAKQMLALDAIPRIATDFAAAFGRDSGGLVRGYRLDDADTVVVALGSVLGTIEDVVDDLRERGERVGALAIRCFRPWPRDEVRAALGHARRVVVIEKAFAVGVGGIVGQNVRLALDGMATGPSVHDVIAGLGGRPVTSASVHRIVVDAIEGRAGTTTFLDVDTAVVDRELRRNHEIERPAPHAESILRDLGIVAGGPT
jgi:pyruvate ferredoxin oxidoreductase alpha subunit